MENSSSHVCGEYSGNLDHNGREVLPCADQAIKRLLRLLIIILNIDCRRGLCITLMLYCQT